MSEPSVPEPAPNDDPSLTGTETSPAAEASPSKHPTAAWLPRLSRVASFATGALAVASLTGLAGRAWWVFALAGNFRVQYFWGLLLGTALLLATGRRKAASFAAALLVVHGWLLWPFYAAPSSGAHRGSASSEGAPPEAARLRIVTLNVWARNAQYERVVEFVRKSSADIVVLEEIYPVGVPHLKPLENDFPYHSSLTLEARFGMVIFSRWPLERARNEFLSDRNPVIAARVLVNETPLEIFGVHLSRPLTRAGSVRQANQLADLPKLFQDKSLAQIVVGDFNATPWNPGFFDFLSRAGLSESRLGCGVQASWPSGLPAALRIPIDHCLVSNNIHVVGHEVGPSVGSDHLPVIVDLEVRRLVMKHESNQPGRP